MTELVRGIGTCAGPIREVSVKVSSTCLTLLPTSLIREKLKSYNTYYNGTLIIIGSRSMIIPLDNFSEELVWFYSALLDFIDANDEFKDSRVEVGVRPSSELPCARFGKVPRFSTAGAEANSGLDGDVELDYVLGDGNRGDGGKGEGESGSLFLRIGRSAPEYRKAAGQGREPAIRSGDSITIRFRKGSIYLHIRGRAFRTGRVGDYIPVVAAGLRNRFSAIVTGPGEAEVEIR